MTTVFLSVQLVVILVLLSVILWQVVSYRRMTDRFYELFFIMANSRNVNEFVRADKILQSDLQPKVIPRPAEPEMGTDETNFVSNIFRAIKRKKTDDQLMGQPPEA